MFFQIRPIKVVFLCFIKKGLVVITPLQNCFGIKFGGPQPPAYRIGLIFYVSKAVDLFRDGRRQCAETSYEFLLLSKIMFEWHAINRNDKS